MKWLKKLFVSNLEEEKEPFDAEKYKEERSYAAPTHVVDLTTGETSQTETPGYEVPEAEPVVEEMADEMEEIQRTGIEHSFLYGTPDHILFRDSTEDEYITGHGYGSEHISEGDWVTIKGVTGNIERYILTRVEWATEPPNMFTYDAQLDQP